MEAVEQKLRSYIREALEAAGVSGDLAFALEFPADMAHGDYATNAAMVAAKRAGKVPREVAEAFAASIRAKNDPDIAEVSVAGPGFINFRLADAVFTRTIGTILKDRDAYGMNADNAGKTFLYDYTDPNPFKVFHVGHLMSNAIGESLARLAEASGAEVVRICYGGDVGLHVAKTLWGVEQEGAVPAESAPLAAKTKFLGDAYVRGSNAYEDDPAAKAAIDALNKKIFANDPEVRAMWEKGKRWSIAHFAELYKKLGTRFDRERFESEVMEAGRAEVRAHIGDVFAESDGAIVYRGDESKGLHTRVFITKEGLPTYEGKEVGHTAWKFATYPGMAESVVVTANEQNDYFKVVTAALEALHPEWKGKLKQFGHGMMRFASGKMSSRKGNIISGEGLIDALEADLRAKYAGTARSEDAALVTAVAVAGVKYAVLRQATGKDIIFDPEQSLSVEGDSGPYLQYTHARIASVLAKAKEGNVTPEPKEAPTGELARLVARFPAIVRRAQKEYAPHHIANYLIELCRAFNSWYGREQILDGTGAAAGKVALAAGVSYTLRNGLGLLGISAPEKM